VKYPPIRAAVGHTKHRTANTIIDMVSSRVCVIVEVPVCACARANVCVYVRASGREYWFLRVFVFIHDTVILLDVHLIEHFQLVFCDLSIVMEPSYCEVIYNANTTTKECTWIPLHRMIHGRRH
jgi:hypothetical protein